MLIMEPVEYLMTTLSFLRSPTLTQSLRALLLSFHLLAVKRPKIRSGSCISTLRKPFFAPEPKFIVLLLSFIEPASALPCARRPSSFVRLTCVFERNVK